ncbi:SUMF1/EgtB/PvdO family nonheme iron enzyme [Candidatus Parabeggiatoa sp. HSG14]|uniref:SUMF1/EgtB/PvdO family nonheme iron enzyme n=1 Tax=Candidatus Parabeggiatoa sp. HSG14 TaxID=3055593 RepID=UPI0025A77CC5|nr:SUMF1/EgtB/PvdO family nonheme iron enzyme [Thiotrichales bacterium HSG14]
MKLQSKERGQKYTSVLLSLAMISPMVVAEETACLQAFETPYEIIACLDKRVGDLQKSHPDVTEALNKYLALQNEVQQLREENQKLKKTVDQLVMDKNLSTGSTFRDRLKDGSLGPEMVWIPAGSFKMGDIQDAGRSKKPVHQVSISRFAMGKYEVTFAEYDKFASATSRTKDHGWRRGRRDNRPIVEVTWHDAVAYAKWLSQQTGQQYHLPTEAEWEYVARAGTITGSLWDRKQTAFSANIFGSHNTRGNFWEWVADGWHEDYTNAPNDGKTWAEGADNRYRVQRGGSWNRNNNSRTYNRRRDNPDNRSDSVSFRLVRVARTN